MENKPNGNENPSRNAGSGELITWYLARLRNNARQSSLERKLTPLTLVETDKTLIQEIVMRSQGGYEQRCAEILKTLEKNDRFIRICQSAILAIGVFGCIFLIVLIYF